MGCFQQAEVGKIALEADIVFIVDQTLSLFDLSTSGQNKPRSKLIIFSDHYRGYRSQQ